MSSHNGVKGILQRYLILNAVAMKKSQRCGFWAKIGVVIYVPIVLLILAPSVFSIKLFPIPFFRFKNGATLPSKFVIVSCFL